jgi:hypothetical protein
MPKEIAKKQKINLKKKERKYLVYQGVYIADLSYLTLL